MIYRILALFYVLVFVAAYEFRTKGSPPDSSQYSVQALTTWPYKTKEGIILCPPQETPYMGMKWCKFNQHQAEIGSICYFSCREGHYYHGDSITLCESSEDGTWATYNTSVGFCIEM